VIEHTGIPQKVIELRVYAGADGSFDLYQDDGNTYAYEKGDFKLTHFKWDDAGRKLTQSGVTALTEPQSRWLKVIGK
jgi:alpha-glucosidase (family GH31 glycosyl hydrolase)